MAEEVNHQLSWDGRQVYEYAKRVVAEAADTKDLSVFSFVVREMLNYSPPLRDLWPSMNRELLSYRDSLRAAYAKAKREGEEPPAGLEAIYLSELSKKIPSLVLQQLASC